MDFNARLERWANAARVADAAARRRREHWLGRQAEEEGSFCGVLVDLAERGAAVSVHGRTDRARHGWLRAVGEDFLVLRVDERTDLVMALAVVTAVSTRPDEVRTVGDRKVVSRLSLAQVLAGLAAERERIVLTTTNDAMTVPGVLLAVGRDVVTISRGSVGGHGTVYVPMRTVAEVRLG